MSIPLSIANGTQTLAATATEYTLGGAGGGAAIAGPHIFGVDLDCNALAVGDVLQISVYSKALSGGTERLVERVTLSGPQGIPIVQLGPYNGLVQLRVTLNLLAGTTGGAIPWQIYDTDEVLRVDPAGFNINLKNTFGSILRRIHAFVGGNIFKRLFASPAVLTIRNEDNSGDALTLTRSTVAGTSETITPS